MLQCTTRYRSIAVLVHEHPLYRLVCGNEKKKTLAPTYTNVRNSHLLARCFFSLLHLHQMLQKLNESEKICCLAWRIALSGEARCRCDVALARLWITCLLKYSSIANCFLKRVDFYVIIHFVTSMINDLMIIYMTTWLSGCKCWRISFRAKCLCPLNGLSISFQVSSISRREMKLDHVEEETNWKLKDVSRTSNIPFNSSTTIIISIAIRASSGIVNVVRRSSRVWKPFQK